VKVLLAALFHETNTFVEVPTVLADFSVSRDEELLGRIGDNSTTDGFLEAAASYGWDVIPTLEYRASPSGPVDDEVFEAFWSELRPRLVAALERGLDGIYLILHGAMATARYPDVEGELLERIRSFPGAADLPLFAVLDLHANVSPRMARHASALIPYRENPHTDARETAMRAARLLHRSLAGGRAPRTFFLHSRILLAPPDTGTSGPVMAPLEAYARDLEKACGHDEVGVGAGFAHADTPDTGLTFWVVSHQSENACREALESLSLKAQALASHLRSEEWSVDSALDEIERTRSFPALLVEPSDNVGGGAPGDATFLLRALLRRPVGRTGLILNDPVSVKALENVSPGETVVLQIGGRGWSLDPGPVELSVTLESLSNGHFDLEDKQSHLASMRGSKIDMGRSAVVRHDNLTILLTSRKTPPFDLGQWRSQGIDPAAFEVITIKAAVGHRRAYDAITSSSFTVATPGPCSSDLHSLTYQRIQRPIFPLDPRPGV
jgi:microcystin degradation protein MlrC